ncbi:MAG: hypothetical protein JKY65_25580 [Planctomycetes bacterium]|nr:hypothetical protein [Planctomycetota bacterium]
MAFAFLLAAGGVLGLASPLAAQPTPGAELDFGVELELRGRERTPIRVSERTFQDYARILEPLVRAYGGDPRDIKRIDFQKALPDGSKRALIRAEWTDKLGRPWRVEPEWVTGGGRQQVDFELITPRLKDPAEIERVIRTMRGSGRVREGLQSSVHIHVDGKGLIDAKGNATGLINLINLHETLEPSLRRLLAPARGAGIFNGPAGSKTGPEGAYVNRFNRPLYLDHPDLLAELAKLPPAERTRAKIESLFNARAEVEAKLHGGTELANKGWKFRSLNLANFLELNPNLPAKSGSIEFRMNDLDLSSPGNHALQVELYRALIAKAKALAAKGEIVPAPKRAPLPKGVDPALFYGNADPALARAELRRTLESLGLDPKRYEGFLTRNVRAPPALDADAFKRELERVKIRKDASIRIEGEAASSNALVFERLRATNDRPDVILLLPVRNGNSAYAVADALAKRANAALYLKAVAHAGAKRAVRYERAVQVALKGDAIEIRVAPGQRSLTQLDALIRLLSRGITAADAPRGRYAGLPAAEGTLVELAVRYADQAEGRTLSRKARKALEVIGLRGGPQLLLPLLNWNGEAYVSRPTARDLRFRAERYLSRLIDTAEGITSARGGFEVALEQTRGLVRKWAKETGLGETLYRSLLPNRPAGTDPLTRYRRSDGTLKWKELTRDRALREVGGLAHFGMALFLKEVATVTATGDKARIEEFFDGLLTTDFYKQYGLFVAGARVGEVAYVKYLQRFIKPTFVNGLLKTNLTLAAGLALPMIFEGTFEGKTFAISLGSLGLSSAAVQGGVKGIRWVSSLKKARDTGVLARVGLKTSRLAKVGGWFYTAAELAVVLYFAEKIDQSVNAYLDTKKARDELGEAGVELLSALNASDASDASVKRASEAYHEAWIAYRDFLYGPLYIDEAQLAGRLKGLARRAKIDADKRKAAVERVAKHAALKRRMEVRYGSLERYADQLLRDSENSIRDDVNTYVNSYNLTRKKHLDEVYFGNRRDGNFLADLENADWVLKGGTPNAKGDPWGARTDPWANWGRKRARSSLKDALSDAGSNRLQAYEDEAAVFARLATLSRERGHAKIAKTLDHRAAVAKALRSADESLIKGNGLIDGTKRSGIAEAIRGSSGPR